MAGGGAGRVIRTPDQRLRVFISSTLEELADERVAAREAVEQLHLAPVMFELGARPHPPKDLYHAYLEQSHVFIGIYWQHYGWVAPGEAISGLEDEYQLSGDRPKLIYVKRPAGDREARLTQLLDRVEKDNNVSYKPFRSARELRDLIKHDLILLLCERFETAIEAPLTVVPSRPHFVAEDTPLTILFTDVEGSTDLRTRRGDAVAHEILIAHEALVRGQLADHGGREIKALGDGFMIAFTSARRALACAIAIQRAVEAHRRKAPYRSVGVRVGVNTGEVTEEGDDLYGQAVNAAARIAARAQAGEILVSEVTKQLVGSSPEFAFVDRGRLRLKGFPDRWRLYELTWSSAADQDRDGDGDFERTPYVGRQAERAELGRVLERAIAGAGALVLIGGEPGVGKTRLADELMADAARRDVQVFAGHSYEMEGSAPYVAVVEIFEEALARAPSPQAWRAFLGAEAAEITRLIPKLRQLCPDIPRPLELPAEQERRLLFNSVRDVVERTARHRPLLLVFDDLHWADDPTLLCLEHLAERLADLPVLVVATYRDTEVDIGRPLAKTFEDLRRRHLARWITLPRLGEDEVADMLRLVSGQEPPLSLVSALYSETEGNPFFVEELYRYLAEEDRLFDEAGRFRADLAISDLDVPAGVRLVIGRRLQRLDQTAQRVLAAAAVVGRAFSVELLETMDAAEPDRLLDAVEAAERARLIIPAPDPSGEDRLIFAHELIRQTVVADLSLTRRRRLHARVADAMERHYAANLDQQAATIAHHLTEAAADPRRIFPYLVQAGRWAMAGAAFEEAVGHFEAAHRIRAAADPPDRAELLFELGTALRSAGHWDTAIDAWRQAADAYEALGDEEGIGRVCLAASYNLGWVARWGEATEMNQRGLAALGDRISADRARLLGGGGFVAGYGGSYQAGADMIEEELRLAGQLNDRALLGHGLHFKALHRMSHMEHQDVVDAGLRAIELLRGSGDLWNVASVSGFTVHGLTCLGRFDEVRSLSQELGPLADRLGNTGAILQHQRVNGLVDFFVDGDLDQLEAFGRRDRELCEAAGLPWLSSSWSWLALAQFLRGNWDEARSLWERAVRLEPPGALNGWNASLLFECLAYRGEKSEALALLDSRTLPQPGEPKPWGLASMLLAGVEGLVILGEQDRAAELYPAVIDCYDRTGTICTHFEDGRLTHRAAGIGAAAGRQWEVAEQHFSTALRQAAELPHRPEEAHTRRWYGQMMLDRAGPGDRQQAQRLLRLAVTDYERMGMRRHVELTAALLDAS